MKKWLNLLKYLKPYKAIFLNIIISSLLISLLVLSFPWYFKLIIDNLLVGNYSIVSAVIFLSLLTSIFIAILSFLKAYIQGWAHNKIILDMRRKNYFHLLKLPLHFFTEFPTGKISQRIFEDVDIVSGTLVGGIVNIFVESIKLLVVAVILSLLGFKFVLLFIIIGILYFINFQYFKNPIEETSKEIGKKTGDLYSKLYDVIPGIREVKNFTKERTESKIFVKECCNLFRIKMKNFMIFNTMQIFANIIPAVAIFFALLFSLYEFKRGRISIGMIVMVISYLNMMRNPIETLSNVFTSLKQSTPAIERIEEIVSQSPEKYADISIIEKISMPKIIFKNVCFSYPKSKNVLKNINLVIEPYTSVALVGPTGVGKSTLAQLILRYYLPDSGEIIVGDKNIKEYDIQTLRRNIAVVPQHPHIFYTTILNNIAYGKYKATEKEIINICKEINLHEFIMSLPQRYNSIVGERGVKLSGGQRQLIAIARAMLKNAPILILDEATSFLDSKTESLIQQAIRKLIKNRTTIAIAHRLSTIINSDMIVVLRDGYIEEVGSHEELIKKGGLYFNLYKEQFKSEYIVNL